jgi:type IV pilus assembly protein PilC
VDRVKVHLPLVGPVISKAAISRFSRTLGTLVPSGVPILGLINSGVGGPGGSDDAI